MRNCVECCEVVEINESGRGQIRDYYRNIDDEIICDECVSETHFFCNNCDELERMENCVAVSESSDGVVCIDCYEEEC